MRARSRSAIRVYVSGCTSMNSSGEPQAAGDWAAQYDLSHEAISWALAQAGARMDDVIRKRTFTVEAHAENRPYGEGPAWFKQSCPTSLGCRITGLARPELVVEVEDARSRARTPASSGSARTRSIRSTARGRAAPRRRVW